MEVSIITVNYNGFEDTCQMIESVRDHIRGITYEIIVVDKAADTNELSLLTKKYPFIRAIHSQKNANISQGYNMGGSIAHGKYLLFLKNDTIVKDNTIHYMIERLESDHTIGGVSPIIRNTVEYQLVQFAGYTPLSRYTLSNHSIGNGDFMDERFLNPTQIPYLNSTAMIVKREVFTQTGGLPTQYFGYFDEFDWSLSIQNCGYQLWYEPKCTIYSKREQSTDIQSPNDAFFTIRNRFLFAYRNRTPKEYFIIQLYLFFCMVPKKLFSCLLKKRVDIIRAIFSGILNYYSLKKHQKLDSYKYKFSYFLH